MKPISPSESRNDGKEISFTYRADALLVLAARQMLYGQPPFEDLPLLGVVLLRLFVLLRAYFLTAFL